MRIRRIAPAALALLLLLPGTAPAIGPDGPLDNQDAPTEAENKRARRAFERRATEERAKAAAMEKKGTKRQDEPREQVIIIHNGPDGSDSEIRGSQ